MEMQNEQAENEQKPSRDNKPFISATLKVTSKGNIMSEVVQRAVYPLNYVQKMVESAKLKKGNQVDLNDLNNEFLNSVDV